MKTIFKFYILAALFSIITCCTNTNNKNIPFTETITISIDSTTYLTNHPIDDTTYVVWGFQSINNEDVNNYIYEYPPFLIFSLDSTFVLINTGCNLYTGECTFDYNNIKFDKIKIKEEICPIDALEREIVYMLRSSNKYSLNNNNLILFTNDSPIGLLTIDTINFNNIPSTKDK